MLIEKETWAAQNLEKIKERVDKYILLIDKQSD